MTIRQYAPADVPQLTALWRRVFGDRQSYIEAFFRLLPDVGSAAVAADAEGRILGMACALTGFELLGTPERRRVGYIYAVAVDESARGRGLGAAVTKKAADICRGQGCDIIATLPADDGLYDFYSTVIGTDFTLQRRERRAEAGKKVDIINVSTTEYMLRRESMLRMRPHLHPSYPMLELQRVLCLEYGGGLYACGDAILAACLDGGALEIVEILCAAGDTAEIAADAAASLGAAEARWSESIAAGGERYIASDTPLPPDTVWNIALE